MFNKFFNGFETFWFSLETWVTLIKYDSNDIRIPVWHTSFFHSLGDSSSYCKLKATHAIFCLFELINMSEY